VQARASQGPAHLFSPSRAAGSAFARLGARRAAVAWAVAGLPAGVAGRRPGRGGVLHGLFSASGRQGWRWACGARCCCRDYAQRLGAVRKSATLGAAPGQRMNCSTNTTRAARHPRRDDLQAGQGRRRTSSPARRRARLPRRANRVPVRSGAKFRLWAPGRRGDHCRRPHRDRHLGCAVFRPPRNQPGHRKRLAEQGSS
jgi:hypothetical protein